MVFARCFNCIPRYFELLVDIYVPPGKNRPHKDSPEIEIEKRETLFRIQLQLTVFGKALKNYECCK